MRLQILLTALLPLCLPSSSAQQDGTFTNPIIDGNSADPFVIYLSPYYYMLLSTDYEHELTIYKSSELTNFRNVESRVIYRAPPGYQNVWASEMHEIDGELYIYFAMGLEGEFNRNWVIKALDPTDPMGEWSEAIRLLPNLELPGVDGTILKHNDKLYYVWSGRDMIEGSIRHDSILITEMIDPVTTKTQFSVIRQPLLPWERNVNEGPFFIYNKNVSYLIFAASFTFSEYYCLGLMSIEQGLDPMVPSNWWYGPEEGPVFEKNPEESVYGSGHASFTVSPDGTETWMVYHASEDRERIEHYRVARAEKIEWNSVDGKPVFPRPHGYYSPIPLPSGQSTTITKTTFTNPIISGDSPDPRVILIDDTYYLTLSSDAGTSVKILSSKKLTNFRNAVSTTFLGTPNSCMTEVWSPELQLIDGDLYMYFSARNCSGEPHTLYVSKAADPTNPLGSWSEPKALLLPAVQTTAADGTVLVRENDLHLIYESQEAPYGLHIAKMNDPMSVDTGSRRSLLTPTQGWQGGVTNAPGVLKRENITFLAYSGGNPGGADYCSGLKSIEDHQDPLEVLAWQDAYGPEPIFCKDENENVYGPGHLGFTTSPDGRDVYMTYHAAEYSDRIFGNRVARIEKIEFSHDGRPIFPKPHGYFSPQPLPSGQAN